MPVEVVEEICHHSHAVDLPVHLDGARIFNAAVALGKSVTEITRFVDSIMFCLSKGLAAPVGSMLAGSREFINRARIYRKALGGGMRQAGVLAAAGLIALQEMPARLHEDHANARFLAEELSRMRKVKLDPENVRTNIVIFEIADPGLSSAELSQALAKRHVLANGVGPDSIRLVTHLDAGRAACEEAVNVLRTLLN